MSTSPLQIPASDLPHLKCIKCTKLLTVSPIVLSANGHICGRCQLTHDPKTTYRSKGFERLAKCLQFPCTYYHLGCKAVSSFNNCLDHENRCPLGSKTDFKCPDATCKMQINKLDIEAHFHEKHKKEPTSIIKKLPAMLSVSQKHEVNSTQLILRDNNVGPFLLKVQSKPSDCCVITLYSVSKTPTQLLYTLTAISSDKQQRSFTYDYRTVELYDEENNRTLVNTYFLHEWLTTLRTILRNNNFYFIVKLVTDPVEIASACAAPPLLAVQSEEAAEVTSTAATQKSEKEIESKSKLLEELECWLCKEYLIPPVYNCNVGHSICSGCLPKLQNCPICQAPYTGSRNFALEKLIERIDHYPCKNATFGCEFVSDLKTKPEHEGICSFTPVSCPFQSIPDFGFSYECPWSGPMHKISEHAKINHFITDLCDLKAHQFLDYPVASSNINLLIFDNVFFLLKARNDVGIGMLCFQVEEIGLKSGEKSKYVFTIDFVDQTKSGRIMTINNFCVPVSSGSLAPSRDCVAVHQTQVVPFVKEMKAFYKMKMRKL